MQVRNLDTYAKDIVDPETGDTYQVAARPGVVDVPDKLARNLAKQDGFDKVDDKPEPKASAKADSKENS